MATNDFKPFAVSSNANVTSQSEYEALAALASGFQAGKASSAQVNKALRQRTVMASALAQFIADNSGDDVLDNGDISPILENFKAALNTLAGKSFLKASNVLSEIKTLGSSAQLSARNNLGMGTAAVLSAGDGLFQGNGYMTFPMENSVDNSLVIGYIQWGSALVTAKVDASDKTTFVNFGTPFPNTCLQVTGTHDDPAGAISVFANGSISGSGFWAAAYKMAAQGAGNSIISINGTSTVRYIAVGY